MNWWRFIQLLLIFFSIDNLWAYKPDPMPKKKLYHNGILLKLEQNDPQIKQIHSFVNRYYKIESTKYIGGHYFFRFEKKIIYKEKDLEWVCLALKKRFNLSGLTCEFNILFKKEGLDHPCPKVMGPGKKLDKKLHIKSYKRKVKLRNCKILKKENSAHKVEGLTKYWAQEYTGADLASQKLAAFPIRPKDNLYQIWDTNHRLHGEKISNLICGRKKTALLFCKKPIKHRVTESLAAYLKSLDWINKNKKNIPWFINSSMYWFGNKTLVGVFKKLVKKGIVVVKASGNSGMEADKLTQKMAKDGKIVLVGNLNITGEPASHSNFSNYTTISAPADFDSISTANGEERVIGGTSGATGQVTAALVAFSRVTGLKLSKEESRRLLQKTSLLTPNSLSNQGYGSGTLNSYHIVDLAVRLKKFCLNKFKKSSNKQLACVREKIKRDDTFKSKRPDNRLVLEAKKYFPDCFGQRPMRLPKQKCLRAKNFFKKLRAEAFLIKSDARIWRTISCIYRKNNYPINAKYYASLAQRYSENELDILSRGIYANEFSFDPYPNKIAFFLRHSKRNSANDYYPKEMRKSFAYPKWRSMAVNWAKSYFFQKKKKKGKFYDSLTAASMPLKNIKHIKEKFYRSLIRRKIHENRPPLLTMIRYISLGYSLGKKERERWLSLILNDLKVSKIVLRELVDKGEWKSHPMIRKWLLKIAQTNFADAEIMKHYLNGLNYQSSSKKSLSYKIIKLLAKRKINYWDLFDIIEPSLSSNIKASEKSIYIPLLNKIVRSGTSNDSIISILRNRNVYRSKIYRRWIGLMLENGHTDVNIMFSFLAKYSATRAKILPIEIRWFKKIISNFKAKKSNMKKKDFYLVLKRNPWKSNPKIVRSLKKIVDKL